MAAHRYWRINIPLSGSRLIAEIELRATVGGTDITSPTTVVTADSQNGSYGPANAVKNDAGTSFWESVSGAAPHYLTIDLGAGNEADVAEVKIMSGPYGGEHPTSFDVQYSDDGSSFTTKKSFVNIVWTNNEWKTLPIGDVPGVSVAKVVAYAVAGPKPGVNVSKALAYAVIDSSLVSWTVKRPQLCVMT